MSCKPCGCATFKKCDYCGMYSASVFSRRQFDCDRLCKACYDTMIYFENINRDIIGRPSTHDCISVKENVRPVKKKRLDSPHPKRKRRISALFLDEFDIALLPIAESSDPVPVKAEDTSEDTEMNITFKDNDVQKVLAYGVNFHDSTYDNATQAKSDLGGFLSRPVRILEFQWQVGVTFPSFIISPWALFLANPRIAEKIATYKLLNATLKIKLMLNGSPFHYGRVFVGLRPTAFTNNTYNALPEDLVSTINYTTGGIPFSWTSQKNFYSQRPHVLLNPAKNIPQEIHWPFFSSVDWIEVNNTQDHSRLGVLEFWELNQLQHANDATDPVIITAYAWLEDVNLTGITDVVAQSSKPRRRKKSPKKTDQQKNNVDEYDGQGVVSYPASVVESIATRLTDVPFIGKFARATSIGAGAVKNIASLFGFSNPAILDKQCFMTQQQLGRMPHTSGNDSIIKLSLDPKNELTIDPSTVGLSGDDEMAFSKIAQREGLIHTFQWDNAFSLGQNHLWGCRIWPLLGPIEEIATDPVVEGSRWYAPCGFIAYPFEYWTGSLVFRVQIVCSAFHRGRIGVVYTPDVTGLATALTSYDSVEHFNYIIDISQETDVSFEINWSQPSTWAQLNKAAYTARDVVVGPDIQMVRPGGARIDNGRLDFYIITDLGSPVTDSSIDVNIWLSAGDSFRVATPNTRIGQQSYSILGGEYELPTTIPAAQSSLPRAQSNNAYTAQPNEDDPDQMSAYVLNGDSSGADNSEMLSVYMGEDIRSIRAMIKRYVPHAYWAKLYNNATSNSINFASCIQPNFPIGRAGGPYGSSGLDYVTTSADVWMTYLRYYCQAFIGYRGGIRWKFVLNGQTQYSPFELWVNRSNDFDNNMSIEQYETLHGDIRGLNVLNIMDTTNSDFLTNANGAAGVLAMPYTNTNAISYELPYYHPTRYAEIHCETSGTTNFDYNNGLWSNHGVTSMSSITGGTTTFLQCIYQRSYCAGAEDSSFFFFIGMPPIMTLSNPASPPIPPT